MKKPLPIVKHALTFMKITLLHILIIVGVSGLTIASPKDSYGQGILDKTISISADNKKLGDILSRIEKLAHVKFSFNPKTIPINAKVSVDLRDTKLKDVLGDLLEPLRITYEVVGDYVILSKPLITASADLNDSDSLNKMRMEVYALSVSGTVTSATGETMPGVNIIQKGTTNGAATDAEGRYSLTVSDEDAVLVFSSIGYITQEVAVMGRSLIDVIIAEDVQNLEEVVIVGSYGQTIKEEALISSVATIKSNVFANRPTPSVTTSLQGAAAGLTVSQASSAPGATASILIRNTSSWQGGSDPLYVIDGVISTVSDFSRLNPEDIDNLSVLKDAASAAIYGMRAGNGVILVTTKQGSSTKTQINFQTFYVSQAPTSITERIPTMYESALMTNKFFDNLGSNASSLNRYASDELDYFKTHNFDPMKGVWSNPNMLNHNLSITGGSSKIKYYLSGSYLDQNGASKNYEYKKYSLLAKLSGEVAKGFTFDFILNMGWSNGQQPFNPYDDQNQGVIVGWALAMPRSTPSYINGLPVGNNLYGSNLAELARGAAGFTNGSSNMIKPIIQLKYQIPGVQGLSIKGLFSYNNTYDYSKRFASTPYYYAFKKTGSNNNIFSDEIDTSQGVNGLIPDGNVKNGIGGVDNALQINTSRFRLYDAQAMINYERAFGKHNVSTMAGYEKTSTRGDYLNASGIIYVNTNYQEINGADGDVKNRQPSGDQINLSGQASYFGRLDYNYTQKYLLGFTFRADGTYHFPPDNRWGYFPAVSAGWNIAKESFFEPLTKYVNAFKIRSSYGLTGSSATSPWQWQQNYGYNPSINYILDGTISSGISLAGTINPNITWEKNHIFDIGTDISILDGLANLTIDYWNKKTTDILAARTASTPNTVGASLPAVNYGEAEAEGFEVTVGHQKAIGNFHYSVSANWAASSNKYLKIDQAQTVRDYQNALGHPINGRIWGYRSEGIIRTQADADKIIAEHGANFTILGYKPVPGMLMYSDIRGPLGMDKPDGKVDGYDLEAISDYGVPRITYGLSINADWKGFALNTQFAGFARYIGQVDDYHGKRPYGAYGVWFEMWRNFWTPETPNAAMPDPTWFDWFKGNNINAPSTFWLRDRSFLRLKYVNLSYTVPAKLLSNYQLKEAAIYFAGENLFTFSKYYLDPEQNNMRQLPMLKSYTIGIKLTF